MNDLTDTTRLALLGQACGDAFGAPFEYTKGDAAEYARLSLSQGKYLDSVLDCKGSPSQFRLPGLYTDDTQQALLLIYMKLQGIPPQDFIRETWAMEHRGTGRNFRDVVMTGVPVDTAGLGAAMRVGPVATMFEDLPEMCRWVLEASRTTTTNPVALACAVKFAVVAWILANPDRKGEAQKVDWSTFDLVPLEIWSLSTQALVKSKDGEEALVAWASGTGLSNKPMAVAANGFALTGFAWAVHAALTSVSYSDALYKVCASGGDTDTVGAMAGCLAALKHGKGSIPSWMWEQAPGADYIRNPETWEPGVEAFLSRIEFDLGQPLRTTQVGLSTPVQRRRKPS